MIKAIVFDIGDTVVNNDWKTRTAEIEKETNISLHYHPEIREEISIGKKSLRTLLELDRKEQNKKFPFRKLLESYERNYIKYSPINEKIIELLKKLKSDYELIVLSNTNDIHAKMNKKRKLFSSFDKVFLSNEIGLKKPDKRIFAYLKKRAKHNYKEMLFIDDNENNIKSAKELGMQTILYVNEDNLMSELKNRGIL